MAEDMLDVAQELSRKGEAFALATVVWRKAPSSAQVGYKAIVTASGTIHGWLSGACAEHVLLRESRLAMEGRRPRLVLLGSPEELEARANDGITLVEMQCQSEGSVEIFIEPMLPKPHLVIVGKTPMVDALDSMASTLGWRSVIIDDRGERAAHAGAREVLTTLDFEKAGVSERSFIVVATQGQYDEEAVDKALTTRAAYIGLVASRKRAQAVVDYLREFGYSDEMLARVRAPAGLDLGPIPHLEIAAGVLAELVQLKGAGLGEGAVPAVPAPTAAAPAAAAVTAPVEAPGVVEAAGEALDPVCGMTVAIASARYTTEHEGTTYYFCCPACKKKFERSPAEYLAVTA